MNCEVLDWEQKNTSLTAIDDLSCQVLHCCFTFTLQTLPKLEKEVLDWEQKYKSLTAIDDLKRKVAKLKHELAWAWVIDKEKVGKMFKVWECVVA